MSHTIMGRCAFICKRWEDNIGLTGNLEVRLDISNNVKNMQRTLRIIDGKPEGRDNNN